MCDLPMSHCLHRPSLSNNGDNSDTPAFRLEVNVDRHCKSGLKQCKIEIKVGGL